MVADAPIFPLRSETRAAFGERFARVTVVAAPVMVICFSVSSSFKAAWTLVAAIFPAAVFDI